MAELDADVMRYYASGVEARRLIDVSLLERERTKLLLRRFLPEPPAVVLDVGGGPGLYARWLADFGYEVYLVDPVPLHVQQAAELADGTFTCEVGDARSLPFGDAGADAVLLLGPLYHLIDPFDRQTALREARRACRPGGLVVAAAISRWSGLLTSVTRHTVDLDRLRSWWRDVEVTGGLRGRGLLGFTTAQFHRASDLRDELVTSGLTDVEVFGVEGVGGLLPDEVQRMRDPEQREVLLLVAAATEREPELAGLSSHLLGVGRNPKDLT